MGAAPKRRDKTSQTKYLTICPEPGMTGDLLTSRDRRTGPRLAYADADHHRPTNQEALSPSARPRPSDLRITKGGIEMITGYDDPLAAMIFFNPTLRDIAPLSDIAPARREEPGLAAP